MRIVTLRILALFAASCLAVHVATANESDVQFENEPNDTTPEVLDLGDGAQPGVPVNLRVKGRIDEVDDVDRYALNLRAGDVLGVVITDTSGLDPKLALFDPNGELNKSNTLGRGATNGLPDASPLPRVKGYGNDIGDAAIYVVIVDPGVYVLEAAGEEGTTGRYKLEIVVARPGLEAQPEGTKQIVFVDFDGAKMNTGRFLLYGGGGTKELSPLADFLPAWGLTAADEDDVIDAILATLEENLNDVRRLGLNGDYAASGIPGEFDVEIRNSRDDADTYGVDPFVTRLIIGGTAAESGLTAFASAGAIDYGNFATDDDAYIHLDQLAGITPGPRDLNQVERAPGVSIVALIGRVLGNVASHELGHAFGCNHTDWTNDVTSIMDQGDHRPGYTIGSMGPDGIFGTEDDIDKMFTVDAYAVVNHAGVTQPTRGVHDTLNTIAFGLSTGRK